MDKISVIKPDFLNVDKTKIVNKAINDYVRYFLASFDDSILEKWNGFDNQSQLNVYLLNNQIKLRKNVDTTKPRKPYTAFDYFSQETREKIKDTVSDEDIIPTIFKLWAENEDTKYSVLANEDKKNYHNSIKKHEDKPKSAFYYFRLDEKDNISPDMKKKEVYKELQKRWRLLKKTNIEKVNEYKEKSKSE